MCTPLYLVDTDHNKTNCRRFSLLSDSQRSIIYAYPQKYFNIVNETRLISAISAT